MDADAPLESFVEASSPMADAPEREALSEDAETRAWRRGLYAERNAALLRDGLIAGGVGALMALATIAAGLERPPAPVAVGHSDEPVIATSAQPASPPPPVDRVDGPLKEADLARALYGQEGEIARCFALGASQDDARAGTVTVAFLVSERGAVMDVADVGSTVADRTVVRCVARSMRALSLPTPAGGKRSVVQHTFRAPAAADR